MVHSQNLQINVIGNKTGEWNENNSIYNSIKTLRNKFNKSHALPQSQILQNQLWCKYAKKYYLSHKKEQTTDNVSTCLNLKNVILGVRSQAKNRT